MKILWVSRHRPLESQMKELRRLFGQGLEVHVDMNPFCDAKDVVQRFRQSGCQELILVAPLTMCREILRLGIKPLWAKMKCTSPHKGEIKANGMREKVSKEERYYKFIKFQRLESIDFKFTEVKRHVEAQPGSKD